MKKEVHYMKNIEELLPKNICEISGKTIKITSDEFYNFTIYRLSATRKNIIYTNICS